MSLNWKEINHVLDELDLEGCHIQQIFQRDYRNLYLQLFEPGKAFFVRICLDQGRTRIQLTPGKPGSRGNQPRFSEFLRKRIKGGRIDSAVQIGDERIIRMEISRGGEITLLYVKLWSNAANIIACETDGSILETAFRRPGRNEITSAVFHEPEPGQPENYREVEERDFSISNTSAGESGGYADAVGRYYVELEKQESEERHRREISRYYRMRESSLSSRLARIEKAGSDEAKIGELIHTGDLITANLWKYKPGAKEMDVEDYESGETLSIALDPRLNGPGNAEDYYAKARKIRSRSEHLSQERENVSHALDAVRTILEELQERSHDRHELKELYEQIREESRSRKNPSGESTTPGLEFQSNGFRILVGRTAKENEELLRRYTRGNDTWLHTRDYPGGYVFIKNRPGKSIPLDVLLDAGNLALQFSKAKNNGQADLYYTQVKYLRRPKQGKTGLVLPTQEKNLFVKADSQRLSRLLKGNSE